MAKEKRRGKGEGSITRRKNGTWQGSILFGYDPITGRPRREYFYGKTQKEVKKNIVRALSEIQSGTYIEPSKISVEQYISSWLEGKKPHIQYTTWRSYDYNLKKHIAPHIGDITLSKLQTRDIQHLINHKTEENRKNGKPLSPVQSNISMTL